MTKCFLIIFIMAIACVHSPKQKATIFLIDVDNTLGSYIPFPNSDILNQLKERNVTVVEHTYVVNAQEHRKEFGYYFGILQDKSEKKRLKLKMLKDDCIEATQFFALRPSIFDLISKILASAGDHQKVKIFVASRGLDERIKSLIASIPYTYNGRLFRDCVHFVSRDFFRKSTIVDGKDQGVKSVEKLVGHLEKEKWLDTNTESNFIAIDDGPPQNYQLRANGRDFLAKVEPFYYYQLLDSSFIESDAKHLAEVYQAVTNFISDKDAAKL